MFFFIDDWLLLIIRPHSVYDFYDFQFRMSIENTFHDQFERLVLRGCAAVFIYVYFRFSVGRKNENVTFVLLMCDSVAVLHCIYANRFTS